MSASLIRRGLELLSNDIKDGGQVKKAQKKKKQQQQTPGSSSVMALVGSNRQGVSRQVRRLQGRLGHAKSKATVKDKRIKSAVEEFRRTQKKSQLSTNLKYFMKSGCKAVESDTCKILNYNSGRQSRHRPEKAVQKSKEPASLFTEEEFQQFQMEYFGRTVEDKK